MLLKIINYCVIFLYSVFRILFLIFIASFSNSHLSSAIFDKDAEVRSFRAWANWNKPGANIPKAGQYEALDILNFIADKGLAGSAIPPTLLQNRDQKQYLVSIAQSILQGRGFDRGVTNQSVNASEMTKYRNAVATIGQHINRAASVIAADEVSKATPGAHIDKHVRIANELLNSKPQLPSTVEPLYTIDNFIRAEAARRDTELWPYVLDPSTTTQFFSCVRCYTTDVAVAKEASKIDMLIFPLKRKSNPTPRGTASVDRSVSERFTAEGRITNIHYNVYIADPVEKGIQTAKGVIVKVYGADIKQKAQFSPTATLLYNLAQQGYIVYELNVRGTDGFGDDYMEAQGCAEGVTSVLRDVSYFVQMMKRAPRGAEPCTEHDYNRYPKFSRLIVGQNIPTALTGSSFGGYMTMLLATHGEHYAATTLDGEIFRYDHRTSFDAYIPIMGISNRREHLLTPPQIDEVFPLDKDAEEAVELNWWKNAFQDLDIVENDDDNIKVSPIYRADKLEKPVLVMHGLIDTTVSPLESLNFIGALVKARKEHLVAAYYDKILGHFESEMVDFDETIFRFMDSVAWYKRQKIALSFPVRVQKSTLETAKSAEFFVKAETESSNCERYKKYIFELLKKYRAEKRIRATSDLCERVWQSAKSTSGLVYVKALLLLKADENVDYKWFQDVKIQLAFEDLHLDSYFAHAGINLTEFLDVKKVYLIDGKPLHSGELMQYFMAVGWVPSFSKTGSVLGIDICAAPAYLKYDALLYQEFLDIVQNRPYILDSFDRKILRTSLYDF